jgi:hemerythrin
MKPIEWRADFATGIAQVDHEHQELIGWINDLLAAIDAPDPSQARITEMLGEIHAHVAGHFALEEQAMRESGYDQYSEHKADHEVLLDDIRDLMDEAWENPAFDRESFSRRLSDWFGQHFSTRDARLHGRLHGATPAG